jgi:hypothetical protein
MKQAGWPVPPPSAGPDEGYSGKWQLRTPAQLNGEQRERVRDCLKKQGLSLPFDRFESLIGGIEASIAHFRATEGTFRDAHDALRHLWELGHDDDPPLAVLRARIQALPEKAIAYIDHRAPIVIKRLFPTEPPVTRFRAWAATANAAKLIPAIQILSSEGARVVEGRSRGDGKRSGPRLEPVIMGEVRGAGTVRHTGGRPRNEAYQSLVMYLALDWIQATGEEPAPGQSDQSGFGDLVHSIFQWLSQPEGSAAYALRQYWAVMKSP